MQPVFKEGGEEAVQISELSSGAGNSRLLGVVSCAPKYSDTRQFDREQYFS